MDDRGPKDAGADRGGRRGGALTGGPRQVLAAAFGIPVPPGEEAIWNSLSEEQRTAAIRRLTALLRFDFEFLGRAPTAEAGAAEAGLSLNRWYEMHARWRERRSLSSIGIAAAQPRSRSMSNHDDLQRLVVPVVDADPEASVRQLSFALAEAYVREVGEGTVKAPSENTLRKFVQAELRRRATEAAPGNEVMFDCCGCTLPHADGVFMAFLVLDKGTRAVLGAALGDAAASRAGYAAAARDALDRIAHAPLVGLDWAGRLERSELVFGLDEDAWANHAAEMKDAGMRNQLQPVTRAKRFGAYVRPLLGPRMGRVRFVPGKVSKEEVTARATPDDDARLAVEVDVHNAARVAERRALLDGPGEGDGRPPAMLVNLLKRVTKA